MQLPKRVIFKKKQRIEQINKYIQELEKDPKVRKYLELCQLKQDIIATYYLSTNGKVPKESAIKR